MSRGDANSVAVIFKTQSGFQHAAWAIAKSGCWSMFKGGLVVNASGPAELYFEVQLCILSFSLTCYSRQIS